MKGQPFLGSAGPPHEASSPHIKTTLVSYHREMQAPDQFWLIYLLDTAFSLKKLKYSQEPHFAALTTLSETCSDPHGTLPDTGATGHTRGTQGWDEWSLHTQFPF